MCNLKQLSLRLVLISVGLLFAIGAISQSNNSFVQFRIVSLPNAEAASEIDKKISSKSGVIESITDYVTSTYFCLMSPDAEYTEEDFINWFAKLGFEIMCYSKGTQNVDQMVSPHILKSCEEPKKE